MTISFDTIGDFGTFSQTNGGYSGKIVSITANTVVIVEYRHLLHGWRFYSAP